MEKILKIEERRFEVKNGSFTKVVLPYYEGELYSSDTYHGFIIHTNIQDIVFGISDYQSCCEDAGYLTTNDNIDDFVGAELKKIILVDKDLNHKAVKEIEESIDEGNMMFANIYTSNGVLQLVAYNRHNGYYSHDAVIVSKQLNYNTSL